MKNSMCDERVSLWDLGIREFHIERRTYTLQEPPKRGGSCLVYRVLWHEKIGTEVELHERLLKEFYPVLDMDDSEGIHREEDGGLSIPAAIKESVGYQQMYQRFLDSYRLMVKLGRMEDAAEHSAVAFSITEANGTWYVEEAYDTGQSLAEIFGDYSYPFDTFLGVFEKCVQAVERLHELDFYHLDLKPQNISYTKRGVVKFFDVDSFVRKERLEEGLAFSSTKGYSAPEMEEAVRDPGNAPYLIGPWTDLYSLTQILCWYLFGHPLEEDEIEYALECLEEKIQDSYELCIYELSRKGLYRLKLFLMCGLHPSTDMRYQELSEAVREIRQIREYLFYRDEGEPHDNFYETEEWLPEYEEVCEWLHQEFFPEDQWWNNERVRMASLIGISRKEREDAARFYATVHRLDYSNIIEIHCKDFTEIVYLIDGIEKEGEEDLLNIRCTHDKPYLFLIFDESDRRRLRRREAKEIGKLTMMDRGAVLFVGRYHHFDLHWNPLKDNLFTCSVLDLDERRTEQEKLELQESVENEGAYKVRSWKRCFLLILSGFMMLALGLANIRLGHEQVNPPAHYDKELNTVVYAFELLTQKGIGAHVVGVLSVVIGCIILAYALYDIRRPIRIGQFLKEYHWTVLGTYAAVFGLALPLYFPFSCLMYIWTGLKDSQVSWFMLEIGQQMLRNTIAVAWILVMIYWIYEIWWLRSKHRKTLCILSKILLACSAVFVLEQTFVNIGEFLIFLLAGAAVVVVKRWYYDL